MNLRLVKIGRIALPRGIVGRYRQRIKVQSFRHNEALQLEMDDADADQMAALLRHALGKNVLGCREPRGLEVCVLAYKAVGEHDDDWDKVQDTRGKWVAPAFLHVVLSGRCTLRVGAVSMDMCRGDVFLMNPNIKHEVTSKSLCMTYTIVVPAAETLRLASQ